MSTQKTTIWSLGLVFLSVCCLFFVVRGFQNETHTLHSRDFKPVYGAARCLLAGCNPYDTSETKQQYLKAGGIEEDAIPFRRYNSTYPPSIFVLILPIAWLPWTMANTAWLALIAVVMSAGAFLVAELCWPYAAWPAIVCIGLSLLTGRILLMLGQPAGVAIGFGIIGVWCLLKGRHEIAGVVCLAISLACKPQIAALLWVYFFLADARYRRRAVQAGVLTAAVYLAGILWVSLMPASSHWMRDLHTNLAFMVERGNPADPGPADKDALLFENLQSVVSVFRDDPRVYNSITFTVMGAMLLAWFYLVVRTRPSLEKDFLAIASAACFTMLPVYHRNYDVYLVLLSFPALALLFYRRRLEGKAAFVLSLLLIVFSSSTYAQFFAAHYVEKPAALGIAKTLILGRSLPLLLFALGLFYLVQFFRLGNADERDRMAAQTLVADEKVAY